MCLAAPVKKVEPKVEVKAPKKRVKKDENAPKKAMPPFFCYQGARRAGLKAEKPEAANPELIKVSKDRSVSVAKRLETHLCFNARQIGAL